MLADSLNSTISLTDCSMRLTTEASDEQFLIGLHIHTVYKYKP